jgi:hypothetical protein
VQLRPGKGKTARDVDPDCKLSYIPDKTGKLRNAHISTFLQNHHNIRAAKVNAQIKCRRVSMSLFLQVTLWKTGALFPHKQSRQPAKLAKGNLIKNQKTWRKCKNRTTSTFYGTAFGSVVFQGVTYSNSLQTPKKVPLACGT